MLDDGHQKTGLTEEQSQDGVGYSFPIVTLWMVYAVILVLIPGITVLWGRLLLHGLFLLIAALFLQLALSEKSFRQAQQSDSTLTRASWRLNYLLFLVVIPVVVWTGLMAMRSWSF